MRLATIVTAAGPRLYLRARSGYVDVGEAAGDPRLASLRSFLEAGRPAMDVLAALEEPLAARLVAELPDDPGRWRFTHALVRECLYDALGPARRAALHRTIGETLERLHGTADGPHLDDLAYHFTRAAAGGDVAKAIEYCTRAREAIAPFPESAAKRSLLEFVEFALKLQGDEKSEAQSFLDHFFRALGHKAVIEAGAKANHLSYIGDATVGAGANVGAGMLLREGARALLKFFPGWGNVVCGMVAGAGTFAIGHAASAYFLEGVTLGEARRTYLQGRRRRKSATPQLK